MGNSTLIPIMALEESALGKEQSHHPREFETLTYAYPVISRRSGGISIGVNLNLDKACNFDCPYCQVDRTRPKPRLPIEVKRIGEEVGRLLDQVDDRGVFRHPRFAELPDEAKRLKDIAISGDGEPTMVPEFPEAARVLSQLQASRPSLDFKLVLITNSTLLDRPAVLQGIGSLLSRNGEVWAKLDAGTEAWYQKINVSRVSLDRIEANLIRLGKEHPFRVQTMLHGFGGGSLPEGELDAYLARLRRVKDAGSLIREVQLYTLARKPSQAECTPIPAEALREAKLRIESETGIPARIYGVAE